MSAGNVSEPIQSAEEQDGGYLISRNLIRNTGNEYHGCAGVVAGYVADMEISYNDIADTSNGAVTIGWG